MSKIRMGMVGGGEGAFIGQVHRLAAFMDGDIELVCGAFSSDPDRSIRSGEQLHLPPERCYTDYQTMMASEAELPADQRMQFVAIVTPNHLHYPVAKAALEAGFHVMSDKPATLNLDEALALKDCLTATGLLYGLTHVYTGYPLIKEARHRINQGELGTIRKVLVEYPQGWLAQPQQEATNKQAGWRLDPKRAGASCCMGDIGVHAANLAEYLIGDTVNRVCSDLSTFVENRVLDDDGDVLLRFSQGAKGLLTASQICVGEENALKIRVYGDKGGLEWSQQEPNTLWLKWPDRPVEILRTGGPGLSEIATLNIRAPAGHPEGYLEAFANIYRAFVSQLISRESGTVVPPQAEDLPGIEEAIRGMAFIESVVNASQSDQKWHAIPTP